MNKITFLLTILPLVTVGCASFDQTIVKEQSVGILDRLESSCLSDSDTKKVCTIKDYRSANYCFDYDFAWDALEASPYNGKGTTVLHKQILSRYNVHSDIYYRTYYYGYVHDYIIGDGSIKLSVERDFRGGSDGIWCGSKNVKVKIILEPIINELFQKREVLVNKDSVFGTIDSESDLAYLQNAIKKVELNANSQQKEYAKRSANWKRYQEKKAARHSAVVNAAFNSAIDTQRQNTYKPLNSSTSSTYQNSINSSSTISKPAQQSVTATSSSKKETKYYTCEAYYDQIAHESEPVIPTPHMMKYWGYSPQHAASRWLADCQSREKIGDRKSCRVSVKTCRKVP